MLSSVTFDASATSCNTDAVFPNDASMRMQRTIIPYFLIVTGLLLSSCSGRGDNQSDSKAASLIARKSPIVIARVLNDGTYIKVVYGQPYKRGRKVFGNLVPYGEVWRTGANEATELTVTEPILFGGDSLAAGTYSLFSIPNPARWTIILNNRLGQWGAYEYDSTFDYLRVQVPAEKLEETVEAFSIQFGDVANDTTSMIMKWDRSRIAVPIRFLR